MRLSVVIAIAGALAPWWQTAIAQSQHSFTVYDNLFYRGKPNTAPDGLVASNILYEDRIWPQGDYSRLPDRGSFEALVRAHIANPGPLVIDIEKLPVKGSPEVARHNMEMLAALADWAHAAAPGKVIGFYGTNTLSRVAPSDLQYARALARHVDAFFPPMYTFDDDRGSWEKRAAASAAEARALGPNQPVYFYLWPQYHDGTPKQFRFVDYAYWKFQLETAHRYSDGIVLWSPSRYDWSDATGWWSATQQFLSALAGGRPSTVAAVAVNEPVQTTAERAQQNLVHYVAPQPDPQLKNFSGAVNLHVVVGADGKVVNLTTISGDPRAAETVVEAVRQWQYKPFTQDGKPVAVTFQLDVPLQPQPSAPGAGQLLRWAWSNPHKRYVDLAFGKHHYEENSMHACRKGYAMTAVEIDKDVLLCLQLLTDPSSEETKVDRDPGTERDGARACPAGWYMRGLHAPNPFNREKTSLLCSRSSSVTLGVERKDNNSVETPVCEWQDVGACPKSMQSCPNDVPVMTGVHFATWHGRSAFLCARPGSAGVRQ